MARLGDIATYINGYAFKPDDWGDEGMPIIRIQDLTGNAYKTNRFAGKISEKYKVIPGDILISWSASLGVYIWNYQPALLNQHIFKVVFDKVEINKDFFVYQVQEILNKSQTEAHGATMKHLTKPAFDSLPFYLPNINEQNEIANILNKITGCINKRKLQLQKLDDLVKSQFIEMFGDISRDNFVPLSELCKIITDGTHQPSKFCNKGIPFLFVSNLVNNEIDYHTEKFISRETYSKLIKRTPIELGDILLSTVGSYGHPAVITENKEFCFQRHIAYLKPKSNLIESRYLYGALLSPIGQEQIERGVKGIAQKTLNLSEIRKIRIPSVSLEQQKLYSAFYHQTDIAKLKVKQSLEQLETLKKSLMQKYFG